LVTTSANQTRARRRRQTNPRPNARPRGLYENLRRAFARRVDARHAAAAAAAATPPPPPCETPLGVVGLAAVCAGVCISTVTCPQQRVKIVQQLEVGYDAAEKNARVRICITNGRR